MKIRTPSFYKDFKCIAGDCPDSCCQGWEVDADEESLKYYKALPNCEIKSRIESVKTTDEYGNIIFAPAEKMRCPFLNSDNLCDMHIAIGAEHTPYTCRMFPRFINDFGSLREMGIAFSCPVASDMMFALSEPLDFSEEMNDEPPTLNDIDASLYFTLVKAREKAYNIMQNSSVHIKKRLSDLLDFAYDLQNEISPYDDNERYDEVSFFNVFSYPELINPEWSEKVKHGTACPIPNEKWCENIAMYFLYRYFLSAVFDSDVLSKVKMAVVGVLVTSFLGGDSWTIHLWSKETEHSDANMEQYKSHLRNAKCLSCENLKGFLVF